MTAPDVAMKSELERTDDQLRTSKATDARTPFEVHSDELNNGIGGFMWCEGWGVNEIQDAVCGHGVALVESRDDDTNAEGSKAKFQADGENVIDSTLKNITGSVSKDGDEVRSREDVVDQLDDSTKSTTDEKKEASNAAQLFTLLNPAQIASAKKASYERFLASIESASNAYGSSSLQVAELYVSMGMGMCESSDDVKSIELAIVLFEEAFNIFQARSGDSDVRTIDSKIRLGKTLHSLGRHDEALNCFCNAVYMREALLGELHPSVSDVWVLISSVHYKKHKLEMALRASAKALTGYRNAHGDKHGTVIAVLKTIAQIHIEMGNNDKAEDINKYVRLHSAKVR
ncbi:predicted protein [Thalassiosira pseudonana CCMP1335]|jgi:tetratricopeptide (TPR) repeat protein|uniref:Kinesin light chain n=1 Tax=Thalassiosira pseudonana TaxID=35128 RepID=B8BZY4_THAPS|nr:predicted protein [Thalassiosira pseudonana CCMP1335]EED93425.1 predicted protein [Thalassiosira pseudonana CCMP1335]